MKSGTWKRTTIALTALLVGGLATSWSYAQCCGWRPKPAATVAQADAKAAAAVETVKPQTKCPAMGGAINKKLYVDVKGYRVYVCCAGCRGPIKADPDKYLAKIKSNGETPEKAPQALCGKCGEIKGTDKCCRPNAKKCGGCGRIKGAPGCCK